MPQLKVQNYYTPTITAFTGALGDATFTLSVAPTYSYGYIVLAADNINLREIVYYHDKVGNTISVRAENRGLGGTTPKQHGTKENCAMKDVAEIFNFFSDNISQCFNIEKTGGLTVKVWGGTVFYNGVPVTVADTNLTLANNTTNYIKYSYPLNTVSFDGANVGNIKAIVVTSGGVITSITYSVAKESYIDFTVAITGALPPQAGNAGLSLMTNGSVVSWGTNNNLRTGQGLSFQNLEIDAATGNEVKKAVGVATTYGSTDTIRKRKTDGTYEEVSKNIIQAGLGLSATGVSVEAGIVAGDPIGLIQDGIYKIQTENTTSNSASTVTAVLQTEKLSSNTYAVCYRTGGTLYARICTVSGDTVTFGAEHNIGSAGATVSGGMAMVGASKLAFVFMDTAASTSHPVFSVVGTISGTTITLGSSVTVVTIGSGLTNYVIGSVGRIRDDAFAFGSYDSSGGSGAMYACTISGTVPSTTTTLTGTFLFSNIVYLADNRIAVGYPTNGSAVWNIRMFEINPASLVITTTYTSSIGLTGSQYGTMARYSDTSFVAGGYTVINDANIYLFEKPGAGTVLTQTSVGTLTATSQQIIPIYDGIFGVHTGTTIIVRDGKEVLWTILGVSAMGSIQSTHVYMNGRLFHHSNTNLQSRIIRIARALYAGIAIDSTGTFFPRFSIAPKTGVIAPYIYYLQANGTVDRGISTVGATRFARAIQNDLLVLE